MKKNTRQILITTAFILLILAVSGCGSSTATDIPATAPTLSTQEAPAQTADTGEPEESIDPTASPKATETAETVEGEDSAAPTETSGPSCSLALPSDKDWPVTLCEPFDDNSNNWQIESQDNPYARYSIDVANGKYELDYTAKGFAKFQQSALTWFDITSAEDFALSVTTLMNSDYQNCSWGVAFHGDEDSFFLFSIYNDATYAFEIYENEGWIPLISQRGYDGILTNAENKLTILAEGGNFTFYINDELVNTFSGGLLTGTDVQLVVSAKEGASAAYYFDDLVVQTSP